MTEQDKPAVEKRGRGRPRSSEKPAKRVNVTFRASERVHTMLKEAAGLSGYSISECVERHLEQGFERSSRIKVEDIFIGGNRTREALRCFAVAFANVEMMPDNPGRADLVRGMVDGIRDIFVPAPDRGADDVAGYGAGRELARIIAGTFAESEGGGPAALAQLLAREPAKAALVGKRSKPDA